MKFLDTAKRIPSKFPNCEVFYLRPEIKNSTDSQNMSELSLKQERSVISLNTVTYSSTLDEYLKLELAHMNLKLEDEIKKSLKNNFHEDLISKLFKLYKKKSFKLFPNLNYIQLLARRFLGIEENIFLVKDFHKFIKRKLVEYQKYSRKSSPILIMGRISFVLLADSKEFSFHNTEDMQAGSVNYMGNYLDKYKVFVSSYEDNYSCLIGYETKENESGFYLVEGDTETSIFKVSGRDSEKIIMKFHYALKPIGDFAKFHRFRLNEISSFNKIKRFILKLTNNAE